MKDYIKEFFSVPAGLEPEYTVDGITFYSSEDLKQKFVISFSKSSKGKHVSELIEKLVKDKSVIPCYKSKNILSFIKYKLSKNDFNKAVAAFYSPEDKKVVVIVDNSSTIFGTSTNNEIASTTLHECMHLSAGKNLTGFISIFLPSLIRFYSSFYSNYFSLKTLSTKNITPIIKFMVKIEKNGFGYANSQLGAYYKLIDQELHSVASIDEKDFQERLSNLMIATKLFLMSPDSLIKNRSKFSMIFTSLDKAYEETFGEKNSFTFPIQEMVSLSEVACVLAEMKSQDSLVKKLLSNI